MVKRWSNTGQTLFKHWSNQAEGWADLVAEVVVELQAVDHAGLDLGGKGSAALLSC